MDVVLKGFREHCVHLFCAEGHSLCSLKHLKRTLESSGITQLGEVAGRIKMKGKCIRKECGSSELKSFLSSAFFFGKLKLVVCWKSTLNVFFL